MAIIDDEELDQLRQKAQAWDNHVLHRLTEGYVGAKLNIDCVGGNATIRVNDRTVCTTPFGKFTLPDFKGGYRDFNMRPGDRVTLDQEVKLTIS